MIHMFKTCSLCGINQSQENFTKYTRSKDGLYSQCKSCLKNRYEKTKDYQKCWIEQNKENIISYRKEYYKNNNYDLKEYAKKYNKDKYIPINKPKFDYKEWRKRWSKDNPHIIRWRGILNRTLLKLNQNKLDHTSTLLKYTPQELKEHLDNLGMDWNKHQIDHKIPITWFKSETPPHIVNDLRNLHPLEESINKSKNNRFSFPVSKDYLDLIKEWIKEEYRKDLAF